MTTRCRFCNAALRVIFADLNSSPLANAFLDGESYNHMERYFPLRAFVCDQCFLVQIEDVASPSEIFSDYAYFSSYSDSWLAHARLYCKSMIERLELTSASTVIEVASNDGYLLRNFVEFGVQALGVEPASNVAHAARQQGVPTLVAFFGSVTARNLVSQGYAADLVVANNVLAHVSDINDFIRGFEIVLKPGGVVTFEFPHLLNLIEHNQFDTIYHEHFSYLSFLAVERILAAHRLIVFEVEELPTHGGSLRVYACHPGGRPLHPSVDHMRLKESAAGLTSIKTYSRFAQRIVESKCEILTFFIDSKRRGNRIVGYGAPAKGNTLLNYCGIGPEFLPFTVDRNCHKQGLYLPGTRIPIRHPNAIFDEKPDYVVILPWNLKDEIIEQMSAVRNFGGRFATLIPRVHIW